MSYTQDFELLASAKAALEVGKWAAWAIAVAGAAVSAGVWSEYGLKLAFSTFGMVLSSCGVTLAIGSLRCSTILEKLWSAKS